MPYDPDLDSILGEYVSRYRMERKKMFGGTCYMEEGAMVCGVWKNSLILRVGPENARKAIAEKRAGVFDITGKPMKGWVMVDREGLRRGQLGPWIELARENVAAMRKGR